MLDPDDPDVANTSLPEHRLSSRHRGKLTRSGKPKLDSAFRWGDGQGESDSHDRHPIHPHFRQPGEGQGPACRSAELIVDGSQP